jgi:hypothetical protein
VLDWLRSPIFYDAVLGLLVIEGAVLAQRFRVTGRGLSPVQLASFLGAGAGFTLACRGLAAQWASWTIALALSAAFACHLLHLRSSR